MDGTGSIAAEPYRKSSSDSAASGTDAASRALRTDAAYLDQGNMAATSAAKSIPITIATTSSPGTSASSSVRPVPSKQELSTSDVTIQTTVAPGTSNEPPVRPSQSDEDGTDNEDLSRPFRTNTNELMALQASTNDNESKTFRKSRRKNIFKSIFCCFSNAASRSKSAGDYSKSGAYLPSSVSSSQTNNAAFNNLNNATAAASNASNARDSKHSSYINSANFTNIDPNAVGAVGAGSSSNPITSVSPHQVNLNLVSNSTTDNNNASPQHHPVQQFAHMADKNSLLPPIRPSDQGKKCLIIDLDETLVHSSFKQVNNADFIVPVEIDGVTHQVYVLKRPFVDEFLKKMGELFECVLFTASLAKYADPVADLLDKWGVFRARLFREACVFYRGNYVKDLSRLGRDVNKVIILDNSPASYIFHPDNAVPCTSWFDDMHDCELMELIPHFERLAACDNIYPLLKAAPPSPQPLQLNNGQLLTNPTRFPPPTSLYIHHQQHLQLQQQQQQQQQLQQQQQQDENQQVPTLQQQSLIYQAQYNAANLNINNPLTNLTNNSTTNYPSSSDNLDLIKQQQQQQQPLPIPIHQLRSKN